AVRLAPYVLPQRDAIFVGEGDQAAGPQRQLWTGQVLEKEAVTALAKLVGTDLVVTGYPHDLAAKGLPGVGQSCTVLLVALALGPRRLARPLRVLRYSHTEGHVDAPQPQ